MRNFMGNELLFHVRDDPRETSNLAEQKPELVKELKERINEWEKDCS